MSLEKEERYAYCSQDKRESTSLYNIPYIVSDCYNIAALCRWNGTYFRGGKNLKGLVRGKHEIMDSTISNENFLLEILSNMNI